MITLYHGSNCSVISPNPLLGRQGTDFGQGFYLTPDLDSARSMAAIVVDRKGEGAKTVNVYEFDEEALVGAGLRIRRFPMMDLDWVSFVIANRNFEREAPDHNLDRLYDVVVGLVADEFGGLGLEEFSELLRTQFAGDTDVDLAVGRVAVAAGVKSDESSTFARRMMTGLAAENFFEQNYKDVTCFKDCALQRTTTYGCGFDFKLTPTRGDFLAVEVKGLRTPSGQIQLTEKEFKMAQYLSRRFYLYVVMDFAHIPKPRVIENPLNVGIVFEERSVKSEQRIWGAQIAA